MEIAVDKQKAANGKAAVSSVNPSHQPLISHCAVHDPCLQETFSPYAQKDTHFITEGGTWK